MIISLDWNSRSPKVNVIIGVKFSKKPEMLAIMNALIPDNVKFPKGLSMHIYHRGNTLFLEFSSFVGIRTLLNTTDEVLEHIEIATKVINDA